MQRSRECQAHSRRGPFKAPREKFMECGGLGGVDLVFLCAKEALLSEEKIISIGRGGGYFGTHDEICHLNTVPRDMNESSQASSWLRVFVCSSY